MSDMNEVNWLEQPVKSMYGLLEVNGLRFTLDHQHYEKKTDNDLILLCKTQRLLNVYLDLFSRFPHKRVLEFGIFEGGSVLFCASLLKNLEKVVGVDLRPASDDVAGIIKRHQLEDKITLHYSTPQDAPGLRETVLKDFNGQRPDIIIDDCSHLYGPTKTTFEMMFPLLAPGGLYIIEDWAWAHWPGYQNRGETFYDESALSNLIFEIIALRGTHQEWFEDITVKNVSMVVIQKGRIPVPEPFGISTLTMMRGKQLGFI
ncbi:MAG: class I SAM-dependent methyltransferase [Deltaproteobacteria bacterium]|nr:class I SAM-dependent methyltransferase [Deltaproteobacteria bacterium]